MAEKPNTNNNTSDDGYVYCKQYTNRWGQLMIASKYGYLCWRFPKKKRKG